MNWHWRAEGAPPAPQGAIGIGAASRRLLDAVERLRPHARETLALTANDDSLIVAGAAESLPWCEGVVYLAPRAEATTLWLPTHERPDLPLDLLARAIARRHGPAPLAMLRAPRRLLPLQRALPASDALLARIRAHWRD